MSTDGYFGNTSTSDPNFIANGDYVATFYRADVHSDDSGTVKLILGWKIDEGQPHSGVQKDEFLLISNASDQNKYWTLQRLLHAFNVSKTDVDAKLQGATSAMEVAQRLVAMLQQFLGRKNTISVLKNKAGYINLRPGKDGVYAYTPGAHLTQETPPAATGDPWSGEQASAAASSAADDLLNSI